MTNYKFGSPEELIKAAEENIVTAAAESGINAEDLQDCIEEAKEGKFQFLSFLMVEQKVKTELADFNLAGSIMGDWAEYIKNEAYGNEVCEMMTQLGYTDIQLKHDIYGKPRMVFGRIKA